MAGSFTDDFLQDIMETVQNATGAPATLSSTAWFVHLYHSTLNDTVALGTTGRIGAGDSVVEVSNTTTTWTLASSTSPSSFENKTVISFTTAASTDFGGSTAKAYTIQSANSTDSGTIYAWGDINPTQVISSGNAVQFSTGALTFILGGGTAT
jgi:hypothetical protein